MVRFVSEKKLIDCSGCLPSCQDVDKGLAVPFPIRIVCLWWLHGQFNAHLVTQYVKRGFQTGWPDAALPVTSWKLDNSCKYWCNDAHMRFDAWQEFTRKAAHRTMVQYLSIYICFSVPVQRWLPSAHQPFLYCRQSQCPWQSIAFHFSAVAIEERQCFSFCKSK